MKPEQLARDLNSRDPQRQRLALLMLGVEVGDLGVAVHFPETGEPYVDPKGDRTKTGPAETVRLSPVDFLLSQPSPDRLELDVSFDPHTQPGTNFAGRVRATTPEGREIEIPMTGRGTYALEGRLNDAHAGLCTGANCAVNQQRIAIILGALAAAGASPGHIHGVADSLFHPINERFHGRTHAIDYAVMSATTPLAERPTYLVYLLEHRDGEGPSGAGGVLVDALFDGSKRHPDYDAAAVAKGVKLPD